MRAFKRESALRRDRDRGNKESLINVVHLGERWEDSRGPVVGEAMRHRRLCCCSLRLMRPKSALGTVTKVWSNGLSHFSFEWQTHRSNWLCRMAAHWQYLRIHYPRCVARRGCLSKLLTLQTCIHLAAVTVAIAIKKKKVVSHLYLLSLFSKIKFLCSIFLRVWRIFGCQQSSFPIPKRLCLQLAGFGEVYRLVESSQS